MTDPANDSGGCHACGQRGAHLTDCTWLNTQSPCVRRPNLTELLERAAGDVLVVVEHMEKHETEHNEDLWTRLSAIYAELRHAAFVVERDEEWRMS